jgi:hypothetical protein
MFMVKYGGSLAHRVVIRAHRASPAALLTWYFLLQQNTEKDKTLLWKTLQAKKTAH